MSNHAPPTLGGNDKFVRLPPGKGQSMVGATCLVEPHYLRGGKVYLFEIDTATGAKQPEPRHPDTAKAP
jgi:hypothetical protein